LAKFVHIVTTLTIVIRELEIVGEAVKNLPIEFTVKYPWIEWSKIAGIRDKKETDKGISPTVWFE